MWYYYLWKWKNREEVNDEELLQIPFSYLRRVDHKLSSPKNPRRRGDESCPKLESHAEKIKRIDERPQRRRYDSQPPVDADTLVAVVNKRKVQEERVHRDGEDAGSDEELVAQQKELVLRIEYLPL